MYFLIYTSIATRDFSNAELLALLEQARSNNEKADVTGMLLYKEGNFMQVLEGEERTVRGLSAKIARDPRHEKMFTLLDGEREEREFGDWSMGFRNLEDPVVSTVAGFSEFMNVELTAETFAAAPSRAQKLLLLFKRT